MDKPRRIQVAIFSGGRGSASISDALADHPQIDLTVLVNAYDDGLSTGKIRQFIPGILGPSDIRKNYSRLIRAREPSSEALKFLLEYRFPASERKLTLDCLEGIAHLSSSFADPNIDKYFHQLSLKSARTVAAWTSDFLLYSEEQARKGNWLDLGDCSLGNLFFAGCYLRSRRDFNLAIQQFCGVHPIPAKILNVTCGENLVLTALKADGTYLKSEAEIVAEQSSAPVSEIFLLADYLTSAELKALSEMSLCDKTSFLKSQEVSPELNPKVEAVLRKADIILYGPGTQHSSLFPSYLTRSIGATIANNHKAEKIFVSNIRSDFEIQGETVNTIAKKLTGYLNRKGKSNFPEASLVTRYFFQSKAALPSEHSDYVTFVPNDSTFPMDRAVGANFEDRPGMHLGGKVVDELLSLVNSQAQIRLQPLPYMVSIIVPGLNEAKTVKRVLHDLVLLNFQKSGMAKEIIFVDGGSTDATYDLARSEPTVRCFKLESGFGRGRAIRQGIKEAQGDVVVFFPSDGEYNPEDLPRIVMGVVQNEFPAVFGSRAIKCVNLTERIREIYRGNYFGYLISKYGGMLLSIVNLLLFNRFISDPLTGIKAFQGRLLKSLNLRSDGVNLDTEIIAKLGRKRVFILELPVDYYPRRRKDGKKTTVLDGIRALFSVIKYRWV